MRQRERAGILTVGAAVALAVGAAACTPGPASADASWRAVRPGGSGADAKGSEDASGNLAHDAGGADGAMDRGGMADAARGIDARRPTSCDDNVMDGDETDVDCGGSCAPCGLGQGCLGSGDCGSWPACDPLAGCACSATTKRCVYNHCSDSARDFGETDVDCGGGFCAGCGPTKACFLDSDCSATAAGCDVVVQGCFCDLSTETCVYSHCFDHKYDSDETDVDCGGGVCAPCSLGKGCDYDTDCASDACDGVSLTCVSDQCNDHQQDGLETAVDCGGGQCPGCGLGKTCQTSLDCAVGTCLAGGIVHVCQ